VIAGLALGVLLAAFAAMYLPWRRLLACAVLMGWLRAVVLLEPAGGQVLCAWGALVLVAGLRSQLALRERLGFVLAAVLVAGTWSLLGRGLSALFDVPLTGGRELLLGAALALPLAHLAPRVAAGLELEPAS